MTESSLSTRRRPVEPSSDDVQRGYLTTELVQCTLPHSDPGKTHAYVRKNGRFRLTVQSGLDENAEPIGLPYGSLSRLLLIWIITEAVRTQSQTLYLNNTLNAWLRAVGCDPNTGRGKRGDFKRLCRQMERLFRARFSFTYEAGNEESGRKAWIDMQVAPEAQLWWDFKNPEQGSIFESYIRLGEQFFKAVIDSPVPFDVNMLRKLKRSPLAIDLYTWSIWRVWRMKPNEQITVSYPALTEQFGAEYGRERDFIIHLRKTLVKVKEVWPLFPVELTERGLVLNGIPKEQLPIQPEFKAHRYLKRKYSDDPFELTTEELIRAEKFAPGWDVRALRKDWAAWCKQKSILPERPAAHFYDFLKEHAKRNG
jgi:hypothetical protein